MTVHDLIHLQDGSRLKTLYYERVVAPRILRAGRVLTVSETSRAAIATWLGRRAGQVEIDVVGNGCSAAFTSSGRPSRSSGRPSRWSATRRPTRTSGSCSPRWPAARISPWSSWARHPDMRRLAVEAGVTERVDVRTGVTDHQLARLYRGADALIMPSREEGFGLPVLEAMSCGTRVVHWAHCAAVAEIAADTGVAVDAATDAGEWAVGMEKAVAERGPLRVPPSWAARYDWDTVGGRVRQAIDELA